VGREVKVVVARRQPADSPDGLGGVVPGCRLVLEGAEGSVEFSGREPFREVIEHERSRLVVLAHLNQLAPEQFTLVEVGDHRTLDQDRPRVVDGDRTSGADYTGPELDARDVPFADGPEAHDEAGVACRQAGLVGMEHHRRVEQRRRLDRVLMGEAGSDQQLPLGRDRRAASDAVGDDAEVLLEGVAEAAVASREPFQNLLDGRVDLAVRHAQDPLEDGRRPGVPTRPVVLTGHEQAGQHTLRIGVQADGRAGDEGIGDLHSGGPVRRMPCWRVESSASVDSAPWLSL
jgi:hypothetical protein